MPFLKPPKPGGGTLTAPVKKDEKVKEEIWTIVMKPGEVLNIEYAES